MSVSPSLFARARLLVGTPRAAGEETRPDQTDPSERAMSIHRLQTNLNMALALALGLAMLEKADLSARRGGRL